MDEPRRRIAAMLSGLDIHNDLGEGYPLRGSACPIDYMEPVIPDRIAEEIANVAERA